MDRREGFGGFNGRFGRTVPLSFVLTGAISIAGLPLLPAIAPPQPAIAQQLSWSAIFSRFRRDKPTHGRRGGVCIVFPVEGEGGSPIRETQPTFLWQGLAGKIALRRAGEEKAFWDNTKDPKDSGKLNLEVIRSRSYDGPPLQRGQTYEVLFFGDWVTSMPPAGQRSVPGGASQRFRVLSQTEETAVKAALTALEAKLKATGASEEAIALERANFFAQRQLWSDAAQAAFSLKDPAPAGQQSAKEIAAQLCRPPEKQ